MNQYTTFWQWFFDNESHFYSNIEETAEYWVPLIDKELKRIHPDLVFEISEQLNNTRQIIISADGILDAFNDVFKLKQAFTPHPRWKMVALRQRENTSNHHVELDGLTLGYEDIFFSLTKLNNGFHIKVFIDGYDGLDQRYVHAYFLLLDALIGEYDAVTYITKTTLLESPSDEPLHPFIQLVSLLDKEKESIKE
jgi:hypothetical protein